MNAPATCDSCGSEEQELHPVHRVYVTPDDWDTEGRVDVRPETARWCYARMANYPHHTVG